MMPRVFRALLIVVVAGFLGAGVARAITLIVAPLTLTSLEWLVADSAVVARGVVVDVADDDGWNIVTLEVHETLKGPKAERVRFALPRLELTCTALAEAKKSKQEILWVLKRQSTEAAREAPDRQELLKRQKVELYAPFVPGRPGSPTLPVIPADANSFETSKTPLALLTIDLRVLKTSAEMLAAIRTRLAETEGSGPVRWHEIEVPEQIAKGTGFSRDQNLLRVPVDGRLETVARRLVRNPAEFFENNDEKVRHSLRREGVKLLRLFPSEANLTILRTWLENSSSIHAYPSEPSVSRTKLIPSAPNRVTSPTVAAKLADVPEVHFQAPLDRSLGMTTTRLHTAVTIDGIRFLNVPSADGFIETLRTNRKDLAGLDFAMGKACRMTAEVGKQLATAVDVFRKAEATVSDRKDLAPIGQVMTYVQQHSKEKQVAPAARVAALMQILGPEDGRWRLALVFDLDRFDVPEATRALAKLAIFSPEADVRKAAVDCLKKRDAEVSGKVLLTGLRYPWPEVAERAADAIAKLGRSDLVPHLVDLLDEPDPRAPQGREIAGTKTTVVRELVRLNHHRNCLLCHAPSPVHEDGKAESADLAGLTAQIPVPSEPMNGYGSSGSPDTLVRFDVTYLRQDFSMKLKVDHPEPWPEMQRYDFLVRTREVSTQEAAAYDKLLRPTSPTLSPYRQAARSALRELSGRDAEPTAAAWRKMLGL